MTQPWKQVVEFFRERKWKVEVDEEKRMLQAGVEGDNGEWRFLVGVSEEGEFCIVLSYFPQWCPQDRRRQCAELLTRINYGMALGGFQMELETGKVVYKTSYPFKEGNFEKDLFGDLLKQNIDVMDHFMPAIGGWCFREQRR